MEWPQQQSEDRHHWEKRIMEAGRLVTAGDTNDAFQDYLDRWLDLKSFYEWHADSIIGAEVIIQLLVIIHSFRARGYDTSLAESVRAYALEQLEELESMVELVLWEAASNANNTNLG